MTLGRRVWGHISGLTATGLDFAEVICVIWKLPVSGESAAACSQGPRMGLRCPALDRGHHGWPLSMGEPRLGPTASCPQAPPQLTPASMLGAEFGVPLKSLASPTASNVWGYGFFLLFHFILDPFYFPFFKNYENFLIGLWHPFLFLNIISESIFPPDLGMYDTALSSVHCLALDATSEGWSQHWPG